MDVTTVDFILLTSLRTYLLFMDDVGTSELFNLFYQYCPQHEFARKKSIFGIDLTNRVENK